MVLHRLLIFFCLLAPAAFAADRFVINGGQSTLDARDLHAQAVLREIIRRTEPAYGPAEFVQIDWSLSRAGMIDALQTANPLTVARIATSPKLEETLVPVRIPVDMGLLSYRVMMIRRADQRLFDRVRTVQDMLALSSGAMPGWQIGAILKQQGAIVHETSQYDALFTMLAAGRFEYLSRGIAEIIPELAARQGSLPQLTVETGLLVQVALPQYFFVSPRTPRLAERLTDGMKAMMADGSLARMVRMAHAEDIARLNLADRRVIRLDNPFLPPGTPDLPPLSTILDSR
jgi:hypothetical protein